MVILITGGTGFIGRNLVKSLSKKYEIVCLVRKGSDVSKIKNCSSLVYGVEEIKSEIDVVINLATLFISCHSSKDIESLIESNITLGTKLLEFCKQNNTKYFINAETFWQFSNGKNYSPVNLYSATKQAFHEILYYYSINENVKAICLYLNDTYGPGDTRNKVFNIWKNNIGKTEVIEMTEGTQFIDILFIDDVVSAFESALIQIQNSKEKISCYKVSALNQITLRDAFDLFNSYCENKLKVIWGKRKYRQNEIMEPNCPYPLLPGWEPKWNLEEGLESFLKDN